MKTQGLALELDYIFFLYGLAFIILGAICTTLSRSSTRVLPWKWLKYFALLHGLNEWLDMSVMGLGDSPLFASLRVWVMLLSFVCLMEFGRQGVRQVEGRAPSRWIYLPLLGIILAGTGVGTACAAALTRYLLGFWGGLWAAAAFWQAGRSVKLAGRPLQWAGIILTGYAVAAGIVVSSANFFPASVLNQSSFLLWTGIPIQILRGLLAISCTICIWNYRYAFEPIQLAGSARPPRLGLRFALLLSGVALLGWGLTETVGHLEEAQLRKELVAKANLAASMMDCGAPRNSHEPAESLWEHRGRLDRQLVELKQVNPDLFRLGLLVITNRSEPALLLKLEEDSSPQGEAPLLQLVQQWLRSSQPPKPGTVGPLDLRQTAVLAAYAPIPGSFRLPEAGGLCFLEVTHDSFIQQIALRRLAPIAISLMGSLLIVGFFVLRRASDALRESEENLAVTLHSIGDAVLTVNTLGHVSRLNPVAEHLTGWKHSEAHGRPIEEVFHIIHEQSRQPAPIPVATVLSTGQAAVLADRTVLIARNGTERCIADSAAPIRDPKGQLIGVVLVFRDITQQQRSREALQRSEAEARKLALIAARTDNGVVLANERGLVEWVNQGFTRITGYTLEEIRGKKPGSVLQGPGSDHGVIQQMHRALMEKRGFKVEMLNYTKQGRQYWSALEVQPLLDAEGHLTHFMGLQSDITERKRAEEEIRRFNSELEERVEQRTLQLRESEQRLAQIIDFLPDATLAVDSKGKVLSWNRAIEKLTGVPACEIIGKDNEHCGRALYKAHHPLLLDFVLHPDRLAGSAHRALRRQDDMVVGEAEFVVNGKRWVLWGKASPLYDSEGRTVGAIEAIRDMTERKDLEQQLRQAQKMEAIGQLAGGVAHDFNNLLTVILGNGEMALQVCQQKDPAPADYLKQVVAAASRAANLTRQLLAFSRKQVMQVEVLNLAEVVTNLTKMLKRLIGENIELICTAEPELPQVRADAGMLEQVLVNLVVNARDAMAEGGRLHVATRRAHLTAQDCNGQDSARPGDYVCLRVTDTGCGIPPENLQRIFEPFFTTKPEGKGTGLGLATVYGIVKQHEGWISVTSRPGEGTTFEIFLPQAAAQPGSRHGTANPSLLPGGTETILLVEDEEAVRCMLHRLLESRGYHVEEAPTGRQALENWKGRVGQIDLLLTDVLMPEGLNGRELARALRKERPGLKVIFMSGYSIEANHVASDPELHARSRFLQKPCSSGVLLRNLRQCLDEP